MKQFTAKRVLSVVLGMVLPLAVVVGILLAALQHSYLKAADSFGLEFGTSMAQNASSAVQALTKENWNSLYIAAAGLPDNFAEMSSVNKGSYLKKLADAQAGRALTFFYYGQNGECAGSDGTLSVMHYTSRTDISTVLTGTEERTVYGPVYIESADSDDTAAQAASGAERSGYVIYFTVPVRNAAGTVVGALSLRRDAYEYCDAISSLSFGEKGYTYLLDETQTVVAVSRSEAMQLVTGEVSHAADETALAGLEKAALAGESGHTLLTARENGEEATVIYAPLLLTDREVNDLPVWGVLVYLPESDLKGYLTAEAGSDAMGNWGAGLAIVLLVALCIFYVMQDATRARKNEEKRKAIEYRDILEQTMHALAAMYDAREVPHRGHGYRVAAYAKELGVHLGLDEDELRSLYFEAILHDIGMISVPESVLASEGDGKLTKEEALKMREHVTAGGRILSTLTALPGIGAGAMYHHQHYDGSGYCSADAAPRSGEEIPRTARIIMLADTLDEWQSKGKQDIAMFLAEGKGKQFDPVMADVLIQLVNDGTIARVRAGAEEAIHTGANELARL